MIDRQPIAKIGDIIHIKGYGNRKYEIFSIQHTKDVFPTEAFVDICYDTVSIDGTEFNLAYQEDITVVTSPENVDYERLEYMSEKSLEDVGDTLEGILVGYEIVASDIKAFGNKGYNDPSKEDIGAEVDGLLDELSDCLQLIDMFGEDMYEGDGYYRMISEEIKSKLTKIIGE